MAPTTPPSINLSLRILRMDLADGGAAGAVAVATSAGKKQGRKAPGGLETPKVSNNFGRRNPPRAAKFDGGVREPELAGGTPSPRKKARDKEDSSLDRLDQKKAFAAVKGRHSVNNASDAKAEVLVEDDSDNNDASSGRPRRETRAAKGGRSANNPADRADDGCRPTKAPPKSGRGVPTHAAVSGRGVPVHAIGGRGVPVHAIVGGRGAPTKIASTGAVATSAEKRGETRIKVSNNFGRRNPPRAVKTDAGGREPETAAGTPRKNVQGGKPSFLFHLDRERAYAAANRAHGAGAETANDDNSTTMATATATMAETRMKAVGGERQNPP
jgi:hypothetical protein